MLMCLLLIFTIRSAVSETQLESIDTAPIWIAWSGGPTPPPNSSQLITFNPKKLGAPKIRKGGGTRDIGSEPKLEIFAPQEAGYTVQKQPFLYWSISKPIAAPIELEISSSSGILKTKHLNGKDLSSGIQVWKLSDDAEPVILQAGIEYKWRVSIVTEPAQKSVKDSASAGLIYEPANADLQFKLDQADGPLTRAQLFAEAGDWYDAFAILQDMVQSAANHNVKQIRKQLLEQVALPE